MQQMNIYLVDDTLNRLSIVCVSIAYRAVVLDAHKLVNGVIDILRVCLPNDMTLVIEKHTWLRWSRLAGLDESTIAIHTSVNIALDPMLDCRGPSLEHSRSIRDTNAFGDIVEHDVVDYKRTCERSIRCLAVTNKGVHVADVAIYDGLATSTCEICVLSINGEVEANLQGGSQFSL